MVELGRAGRRRCETFFFDSAGFIEISLPFLIIIKLV